MSSHEHAQPEDGTSRRGFLAGAAGVAGALAAASTLMPTPVRAQEAEGAPSSAGGRRTYVGDRHTLELEGADMGLLRSATGGNAVAEVVHEQGVSYYPKKHLGALRYEDIVLQTGLSNGKAIYDWIAATWSGQYPRRSGAVVSTDYDGKGTSRRTFVNALLTEITMPSLDAASKDAGSLSLRLAPETTSTTKGEGAGQRSQPAKDKWIVSNFRLRIDGLDCSRVSKIDAFTVKQKVAEDEVGQPRDDEVAPASIVFPDLAVSLSAATAASWEQWFEDFVLDGKNSDDAERSGTLELLAPDLKEVLATIGFSGLGIYRLVDQRADGDTVRRVRAEMYCERMSFALGKAAS